MAKRDPKLLKIRLENRGEDAETPWAIDLGPAKDGPGSRRVRIVNVPFLHAKPTWGDVIVVKPVEGELPTWDAGGVAWSKIGTRIEEDGGRYAMIVDYVPHDRSDGGEAAFRALYAACQAGHDDLQQAPIVCENALPPRDDKPGRAYLAVQDDIEPAEVMATLAASQLPCDVLQIHPEPPRSTAKRPAAKKAAPKQAAKKSAKQPAKRPATRASAKQSAAKRSAAKRSAAKRSAAKQSAAKQPPTRKSIAKKSSRARGK